MASFAAAYRLSARLAVRHMRHDANTRGLKQSAQNLAAQNFTMPALSPTMTEGNIARWNVKEGDSFAAGDVLLEIETDKASMDVEAQDDGILAKIIQGDRSKGLKVGTRIAVIAESGDELSSLGIPEEDNTPKPTQSKGDSAPKSQAEPPEETRSKSAIPEKSSKTVKGQSGPLLPSVEYLLHENGLDVSTIEKMKASGPNNRLLKGDVLAYLGKIAADYPAELSSRIAHLSHLDLSNIELAPPKSPTQPRSEPQPTAQDVHVATEISMKAVLEVQDRINSTLGIFLPLSTFVARATDAANDDLPRPKDYKPTPDELFNQVLGLDKVNPAYGTRGNYLPQITALPGTSPVVRSTKSTRKQGDLIDLLSRKPGSSESSLPRATIGLSTSNNIFSVVVPRNQEERASEFLQRMKLFLEREPGRLVL